MKDNFEKSDRHNFTKTMVDRLRLGRSVQAPVEGAGDEYGNYKKFEEDKNQVKQVNDKGYNDAGNEKLRRNIREMYANMDTPYHEEANKRKDEADDYMVKNSIKNTLVMDEELMQQFSTQKEALDNKEIHDDWDKE